MPDSTVSESLPPETAREIGLRDDLIGEELLKKALNQLLPFVERITRPIYAEQTLQIVRRWVAGGEFDGAQHPLDYPAGTKGLKTDYPIHALLLHIAMQPNPSNKYLFLCAHSIGIAQKLQEAIDLGIAKNSSGVEGNRQAVCRRMRLMSDRTLIALPEVPDEPDLLHYRIERLFRQPVTEDVELTCEIFERSLAYSLGLRNSPFRDVTSEATVSDGRAPEKVWERACNVPDPDDESSGEEIFVIRSEVEHGAPSPRSLVRSGAAPEEGQTQTQLLTSTRRVEVKSGETPLLNHQRSRSAFRHVVKNQQMTPSQWRRLSAYDLHILIQALRDYASEKSLSVALVGLSLLTGTPPEDVLKTQVYKSSRALPAKRSANAIYLIPNERVWIRGVVRPDYAKVALREWDVYLKETSLELAFPIPAEFDALLSGRLKRANMGGSVLSERQRLFPVSAEHVIDDAKALLSMLNKRHGTQFTLHRVQRNLYYSLIDGEGDLAEATLITGQLPPTGQVASIYYQHSAKPDLIDAYKKALSKLPMTLSFPSPFSSAGNEQGVGSEICPKQSVVTVLVADLRSAIFIAKKNWNYQDAWVDFHNAYTRYVVMMVLFSTGHRAVQDPIPYAEDIDWNRALVVIDDKSGDHTQKARVVPLVPECLKQLSYYMEHRESVLARIRVALPAAPQHNLPLFFFLNNDLKLLHVRQKTLQSQLQDTFDLPLNINRHLLRSSLLCGGLPGHAVDAFMGHWSDGQSPFDRFSTMDPQALLRLASEVIAPLFFEQGWNAEEGLS